jgi:hypothetical protein
MMTDDIEPMVKIESMGIMAQRATVQVHLVTFGFRPLSDHPF